MTIWKNSFAKVTAGGASDFLSGASSVDRSTIHSQMHRLSEYVRHDESLTLNQQIRGTSRRTILPDLLVGLSRPSRGHRNRPKYRVKLTLSQTVTRKSLAQEILLLRSCQTFCRCFLLQGFDCFLDFCPGYRPVRLIGFGELLYQELTCVETTRYWCLRLFDHPVGIVLAPQ